MKVAIISDTHLGDKDSSLYTLNGAGHNYQELVNTIGSDTDFLVLLGDILDFSVCSYEDVYKIGKMFFKNLKSDGIIENKTKVIFIPGNHDYDLWHTVEYQTNIINPMKDGNIEERMRFRKAVPGILDDRNEIIDSNADVITIPNVTRKPGNNPYGGLFLDNIIDKNNKIPFYFVYPNLYLIRGNETFIITHGQYFESYWDLGSSWFPKIFGTDKLNIQIPPSLRDLVDLNSTLSHLACSGTGQAGKLSKVFNEIQAEAKKGNISNIKKYLDNLTEEINTLIKQRGLFAFIGNTFKSLMMKKVKKLILKKIKEGKAKTLRDFKESEFPLSVQNRIKNFIKSSKIEIDLINYEHNLNIPLNISGLIFGHTHHPMGWDNLDKKTINIDSSPPQEIPLYNTGGWLIKPDHQDKYGAEIFIYESNQGFRSKKINVVL